MTAEWTGPAPLHRCLTIGTQAGTITNSYCAIGDLVDRWWLQEESTPASASPEVKKAQRKRSGVVWLFLVGAFGLQVMWAHLQHLQWGGNPEPWRCGPTVGLSGSVCS
jgi:hypothetical protein